jgi:hypothetical protein
MDLLIIYTLTTQNGNHSAITNLCILQITMAPTKPFPDRCDLISCSLVMARNSGDSSASHAQFLSSLPPVQNSALN